MARFVSLEATVDDPPDQEGPYGVLPASHRAHGRLHPRTRSHPMTGRTPPGAVSSIVYTADP
jgi:hypothetical protein